jgi:NAD(P)-dependent dehydrogenase (short-subunit alcohol dehydrogenase family)
MEDGRNEGRLILVSGVTGQQGGAVAWRLLERGIGVRALTRDPEKPEARELAELEAEVASGDLEDRSPIERVLDGVHGCSPSSSSGREALRARSGRVCCSLTLRRGWRRALRLQLCKKRAQGDWNSALREQVGG